jgi:hypothetical protein
VGGRDKIVEEGEEREKSRYLIVKEVVRYREKQKGVDRGREQRYSLERRKYSPHRASPFQERLQVVHIK